MTMRQDFTVDSGRDYGLQIALFEADNKTPLNLLDSKLNWVTKKSGGAIALISKSSDDFAQIEITDSSAGLIVIYLNQSDTNTLGAMTFEHELMVSNYSTGAEATLMRGLITISRSAIR